MKRILGLFLLIAVFIVISTYRQPPSVESAFVWYIPFQIETLTPISISDIETHAHYRFALNNEERQRFESIIQRSRISSFSFDNKKVRMKIVLNNRVYFIDKSGGMQKGLHNVLGLWDRQINSAEIQAVTERIIQERHLTHQ